MASNTGTRSVSITLAAPFPSTDRIRAPCCFSVQFPTANPVEVPPAPFGSQVWRSTRHQVQYSYVAQGQPLCWARCPCVVIPPWWSHMCILPRYGSPPCWARVFPGRTLCLLCCVAISPQAGWVYLRDSRMWYCPWPVHTYNLHMISPYAGCGSVAFPPTWGTLSQCYSTHWAEQQCGHLCLNPVLHPSQLVWGDLLASAEHWRGSAIVAFSKGSH